MATQLQRITTKQKCFLSAFANSDLSITELAATLNISPIIAHQHIAEARKTMGMKTNIGAVREAIRRGLIEFS